MTAATPVVNYTAEQSAELAQRYTAGESVEDLAMAFGKTVRSIVAKLAQLGVYRAPAKSTAKAGTVTKANLVEGLAKVLEVSPKALASLEKADKTALTIVFASVTAKLAAMKDVEGFDGGMGN